MFLKKFCHKIWYLIKQNKFLILISIIWSVLLFLYLESYVKSFGIEHGFDSEGAAPEKGYELPYFMLTVPFVIPYLIYVIKVFRDLTFLRTLIYPVTLISSLYGLYACIGIYGGQTVWLLIYLFFPIIFILVIVEIIALILDIKTYQKTSIKE